VSGLPASWTTAPFKEVVSTLSTDGHLVETREISKSGSLRVLTQGEPSADGYTMETAYAYQDTLPLIVFGDHTRAIKLSAEPFAVGPNTKVLAPANALDAKFLFYQLPALLPPPRGYGRHFQFLAKSRVTIAPYAEQMRIVSAIEAHLSRLDVGVAALERVQRNLGRMRASVLQAAVTGGLVPQSSADDPAASLLRSVRDARAALELSGELRKRRPRQSLASAESRLKLPANWVWVELGDLCQLENGDRSKNYPSRSQRVAEGIPFINAGHLQQGRIAMDSMEYISRATYNELRAGKIVREDILFCIRGSLGKVALASGIETGAIASSLVIVRVIGKTLPRFVLAFLSSPLARKMLTQFDNGTAQPNLAAADLAKFRVPLPPLAEQRRIVAAVDRYDSVISSVDASLENLRMLTSCLRTAVLASAFSGALLSQDPNDEPARVLLEGLEADLASPNGHASAKAASRRAR
jgi:hypothetical protein